MGEAKNIYFTCLNYFNLTFPVAATRTMSAWRAAGVTYVRFSNIAASVLRKCVVAEKQESVMKNVGKTCRLCHIWKSVRIMLAYHQMARWTTVDEVDGSHAAPVQHEK